jgi:hypothetical protein
MIGTINVAKAGLVLGILLGGWPLCWAILVASGLAQPIIDFVFWMHFIKPVFTIEPFEIMKASILIIVTVAWALSLGRRSPSFGTPCTKQPLLDIRYLNHQLELDIRCTDAWSEFGTRVEHVRLQDVKREPRQRQFGPDHPRGRVTTSAIIHRLPTSSGEVLSLTQVKTEVLALN